MRRSHRRSVATIARARRGPDWQPPTSSQGDARTTGLAKRASAAIIALAALVAFLLLGTNAFALEILWINSGTGDWFNSTNWDDPPVFTDNIVPTSGDNTFVNNGGTAQAIDGSAFNLGGADAETRRLFIGGLLAGTATTDVLAGTVNTDGVDVTSLFGTFVGLATTNAPSATGTLTTVNGGSSLNPGSSFFVGFVSGSTDASATATGNATIDGELLAATGTIGGVSGSGANTAIGTVIVNGDATGDFRIGTVSQSSGANATGSLTVTNGDFFNLGQSLTVGSTLNGSTANGTVDVQTGTFTTLDSVFNGSLRVGIASGVGTQPGGSATGSFTSASIDTSLNELDSVFIARSLAGGTGIGTASFGTGTLNVEDDVFVGFTAIQSGNGSSDGSLVIDGAIVGLGGGSFGVGRAQSFALDDEGNGQADGIVVATGVSEFRFFDIGVVRGNVQNDANATGELTVGAGGITGAPTITNSNGFQVDSNSRLFIGTTIGTTINGQVRGVGGTSSGTVTVTGGNISGKIGRAHV